MSDSKHPVVLTADQVRQMRAAMQKAGANPLDIAEVIRVYKGDKSRCRISVGGEERDALRPLAQWTIETGDSVYVRELRDGSGRYEVVGLARSATTGDQTEDPRAGRANIPGTELPLNSDGLWYTVTRTGGEEERSRTLIPRPAGGDQPPALTDHYVRVIAGQPDPAEVTGELPGDGLPASIGPFSAIGDRIQITKGLPNILKPRAYCIPSAQSASQGDTLTYQAYTQLNERPMGIDHPMTGIGMGLCDPTISDKTALEFGTHQIESHAEGIELTIDYRLSEGVANNRLYYLKFAPWLDDMFFCVGEFSGTAAVGIGREILSGMPYPYPAGGALGAGDNPVPSGATWFGITPWQMIAQRDIIDRDGAKIGQINFSWWQIYVKYWGVTDPIYGDCSYLRVSDGRDAHGAKKWKTYFVSGQLFGGQVPQDLYGYGADGKGHIYGPILINDREYPLVEERLPGALRGFRGEVAWHLRAIPGDPLPDGSGNYIEPTGDVLPDGLYVWLDRYRVLMLNGPVISVDEYGVPNGNWTGILNNPHSAISHSNLSGLDADDHEQYATVERLPQFLEDAGITADDIPAGATNGYVTPAERTAWDAAPQTAPTQINLTSQVTGATRTFTTPVAYMPGTLRVWVNSTELRNGKDFRETADAQGFEIDYRTPVATTPKDVLRVAYQSA